MDWKALIPVVASVAPTVGSLLGGLIPIPGGSIIGQKLGEIIAKQFGLPATATAAQVSDRIAEAGEETARAKIQAAVEQARIEVEGFVAVERAILEAQVRNLSDVNVTIRAEAAARVQLALQGKSEHWFFTIGRPTALHIYNFINLCFGLMLVWATAKVIYYSPDPLTVLSAAWPLYLGYFVQLAAVNGVYINARSNEKAAAITAGAPMPNAKPVVPAPPPAPAKVTPPAGRPIPPKPVVDLAAGR